MSAKEVVYALRDDKQEIPKQLGCMNGIFQLFDRRYLLGQRRHGHNQKRLPPGHVDIGEKKISNESEKAKGNTLKPFVLENQRVSIDESSRNSFSSSTSSTILSSLECSKRVQTERSSSCQSIASEPSSSPFLHRKKPDSPMQSPDIRDVVKDSMNGDPRLTSIKTVAKEERVSPPMKHIDSPRPFPDKKPIQNNRHDRNFAKLKEIPWAVKEVKETPRSSCDGRESRYLSKSNVKVKELPRLSLDSRQSYINNSASDQRSKRPSSSVVARLMGLDVLSASIDESVTLKTKPGFSENSRLRKEEELKPDRVGEGLVPLQRGVSHAVTRMPLEKAPWKQEGGNRGSQKPTFERKEAPASAKPTSTSIYDEIEKRLTEHEYKTTGKDLRALKQILEAMQKTRSRLENDDYASDNSNQKSHLPVSPTIKGICPSPPRRHEFLNMNQKPGNRTSDSRKYLIGRQQLKDPTPRYRRATGELLTDSNFPEYLPRQISSSSRCSGNASPRIQRSKNEVDKRSLHGPVSDSRMKKQPSMQRSHFGSTNRIPKAKYMDTIQERMAPRGYNGETRNSSQQSDSISFQSESNSLASQNDSEVTSTEWIQEVNSIFRPRENHESKIAEPLTQDKSTADHAKLTMEQPSPVSVLDAFYTEDTPSPVKKKSNAFSDDEALHLEEAQYQGRMKNMANSAAKYQYSEINDVKLENIKDLVQRIESLNTTTDDATINHAAASPCESETRDHRYIMEIVLASGFLEDLNRTTIIVQLHPTGSLISPQLFHVLEETKGCTVIRDGERHRRNTISKSNEKMRRKMVFDTVNDILGHELAMLGPFGPRTKGRILNGDKLLKELCSGIDSLQNNSERGDTYNDDDEVINIINADVNKRSQDWDKYHHEVPSLVLDIERSIFKDLISEVVNAQLTSLQDWPERHRRQLFPM